MMISIVVINNYYELGPVTLPDNMAQPEVKCVGQVWYAIVCSTLKIDILGVSNATLAQHGAVSEQTARAMVDGTLNAAPLADLALSVTGIAGPGGGSKDKPVGLVHFACQRRDSPQIHAKHIFNGDRNMVRQQAVHTALVIIRDALA